MKHLTNSLLTGAFLFIAMHSAPTQAAGDNCGNNTLLGMHLNAVTGTARIFAEDTDGYQDIDISTFKMFVNGMDMTTRLLRIYEFENGNPINYQLHVNNGASALPNYDIRFEVQDICGNTFTRHYPK